MGEINLAGNKCTKRKGDSVRLPALFLIFWAASSLFAVAQSSSDYISTSSEQKMFQAALRDEVMKSLVKVDFGNVKYAALCAVFAQQWKAGRIKGTGPNDRRVSLLMNGMNEVTMFVLTSHDQKQVLSYIRQGLNLFENDINFREKLSEDCFSSMVPILGYVINKFNLPRQ